MTTIMPVHITVSDNRHLAPYILYLNLILTLDESIDPFPCIPASRDPSGRHLQAAKKVCTEHSLPLSSHPSLE